MISSKDFQKLWFLYQTEGAPKNITIEAFCQSYGIPFAQFNTWYHKSHRAISKVQIDDVPSEIGKSPDEAVSNQSTDKTKTSGISITIKTNDGLNISKEGLTYSELVQLVERLEVVC